MSIIKNILFIKFIILITFTSKTFAEDLKKVGKYRNNQMPKNSRIDLDPDFWSRYAKPNTNKAVDAYFEIAKKYNLD